MRQVLKTTKKKKRNLVENYLLEGKLMERNVNIRKLTLLKVCNRVDRRFKSIFSFISPPHLSLWSFSATDWFIILFFSQCINQILESVNHIHQHDIVHRDLKVSESQSPRQPHTWQTGRLWGFPCWCPAPHKHTDIHIQQYSCSCLSFPSF